MEKESGLLKEFGQLEMTLDAHFDACEQWEKAYLHRSVAEAMTASNSMWQNLYSELENLDLKTPQAKYARCLMEGQIREELNLNALLLPVKTDSLQSLYETLPVTKGMTSQERLEYLAGNLRYYYANTITLTAQEAEEALNKECGLIVFDSKSVEQQQLMGLAPTPVGNAGASVKTR